MNSWVLISGLARSSQASHAICASRGASSPAVSTAVIELSDSWVHAARKLGALTQLPAALALQALSAALAGRSQDVDRLCAEMRELITVSGRPRMLGIGNPGDGIVLAYRGRTAAARAAGVAQIREWTARGQRGSADIGRYVVAVADLCAGDCDAAEAAALMVIEDDPVFMAEATLPELVEAAARAGHRDVAGSAFETLSDRALAAGTPWALGLRARYAALIDQGEPGHGRPGAHPPAIRSVAPASQAPAGRAPPASHRMGHVHGDGRRRLRRASGHGAARDRRAGAGTYPGTAFDLTPREAGVADLADAGASNNDIAVQLFISPSTVEHHLASVFRKLGITSRTQLARLRPVNA